VIPAEAGMLYPEGELAEKTGTVPPTDAMDLALHFVVGPVTSSIPIGLRSIQRIVKPK